MNNISELLKKIVKDTDPTLDVSNSSALSDIVINPTGSMLSPFLSQLRFLINNLTMTDVAAMDEGELDAIGSNFLVYRNAGAKARGKVRIYFSQALDMTIPAGTKFYTRTGLAYLTEQPYAVTRGGMLTDVTEFPLYSTGDFDVVAESEGPEYIIGPGTIVSTDLPASYAKVKNILAFSGGFARETNEQYYTRILNAMTNESLASPDGIAKSLLANFASIQQVFVAGADSSVMTRDIVYSGLTNFDGYHVTDYYGKVSGYDDAPYPQSIAYTTFISGLDVGNLPDINDFQIQLTTDQYKDLYLKDDALKLSIDSQIILDETFAGKKFDPRWVLSDSNRGLDNAYSNTITISDNNRARLGRYVSPEEEAASAAELTRLRTALDNSLRRVYSGGAWYQTGAQYEAGISGTLQAQYDAALIANLELKAGTNCVPILHTSIPLHNGIQLDGTFNTSDYINLDAVPPRFGQMSYITFLRNGNVASSVDGYGLAWRVGDGDKFNVYIVDNNTLAEGTYLGQAGMAFNTEGADDYLVAAKKEILSNTDYNFRIIVYTNFQMDVWIWKTTDTFTPSDANRVIWKGAFTPRAIQNEAVNPSEVHTHFGISVLNTNNALWYYDTLTIKALNQGHPATLFKLHAESASFPNGDPFTVRWYGYGETTSPSYGANVYIYNYDLENTNPWTLIGGNTKDGTAEIDTTIVSGIFTMGPSYRDPADNKVNILATTLSSLFGPTLHTYYVDIHTGLPSGVHSGGMADIYVSAPSTILLDTVTVDLDVDNAFSITAQNGFKLPIQDIVMITDEIGNELYRTQDWALRNENKSTTWSDKEQFICTLASPHPRVTVKYRYYSEYDSVQAFIESDTHRFIGNDNLTKLVPPAIISINGLQYRDGPTTTQAQTLLKNYINGLTDTLEITDLLSLMYAAGATYVNLDTLEVSVREFDDLKNLIRNEKITNAYTLPEFRAFYTDELEMTGLVRL